MKVKILILITVVFICCTRPSELPMDDEIILVNAGHKDRKELSLAIDRLARCNPTIVGINFLFRGRQQMSDDTLLANSIKRAGNIVLASALRDGKIISSDSLFTASAIAEGPISYGFEDDGAVGKQMMFISVGDDLVWSFPTTIASYFDSDKSVSIMKSVLGNQFYEIGYRNNFRVVDINDEFDSATISGKIVIIGNLGPDDEDILLTSFGQKRYSTWILANCVRNIRDSYFEEVD